MNSSKRQLLFDEQFTNEFNNIYCASRTRFLENFFSNEHESINLSDLTNEAIDLRESLSTMQLMPIQSIQFDRTSYLFPNYTDLFHGRINLQEQSAKVHRVNTCISK